MRYRHVTSLGLEALAVLFALLTAACGTDGEPASDPAAIDGPVTGPTWAELVAAADRRVATEVLTAGLNDQAPELRRAATLALARLHDPAHVERLLLGLRDTDPGVRAAASLGLGAFQTAAPRSVLQALVGALAAETDGEARVHLLRDLGRLAADEGLPAIAAALRAEAPTERAAACIAAAERGLAGRGIPGPLRARIAALLGAEEPEPVRRACAYALARLPPPPADAMAAEAVALTIAAADPVAEVRAFAQRALGHHPVDLEVLAHGTRDEDWRVAVQAFRALARRAVGAPGGARVYAEALEGAHHRAISAGVTAGPTLHVLLTAFEEAAPLARSTPVHERAVRLMTELGQLEPDEPPTRTRGLAHCAAAELVDRGRGWPSRLEACGLEQVLPRERRTRVAVVLGELEGAEPQRLARLARLAEDRRPVVQQAALGAAARIWDAAATPIVLKALGSGDSGVVTAALQALAEIARRAPSEARVPPPLPTQDAVDALRAVEATLEEDALEGQIRWLEAVDAVGARELAPAVSLRASHPSHALRQRARRLLESWQVPLPDEVRPIADALGPDALSPPEARPRVRLETDRGPLVLALRPDQAPVTVARVLGLVRAGFYDGLSIHRVVPGFVVQGGDPRGDGYGGPDFWLRCEDNRLPFVRGTVGMALAGRDTGGSQFFITLGDQPQLEGRYTAFGAVVEGLERLDQLHPGDLIRRATVLE